MIWHQILWNGLQSTALAKEVVLLSHVLIEEAITTIDIFARTAGTAAMLRTAADTILSGVHFICSLESEVGRQKSEVRCQKSNF